MNYFVVTKSQHFVDFKVSTIKGGKGGDGLVSFLHTKETEWGGPDGGKKKRKIIFRLEKFIHLKMFKR